MKFLTLIVALVVMPVAYAADSGGSSNSDSSSDVVKLNIKNEMSDARSLLKEMNYKAAIRKLNGVIREDYRNADAWNLIGYSNRKLGKYKKAGKAYRKALKYNPEHKGALEYQGELFIETNQLDKARANRASLATLCPSGCEELADLDKALNRFN